MSSSTLAQILKKRRLEKRRSQEDVALRLKISSNKIKALEEGNWGALPASVYTKGYLTKYAQLLGLNVKEVLNLYEEESAPANLARQSKLPTLKNPKIVFTPSTLVLLVTLVFFGIVGVYLIMNWFELSSPPALVVEKPADNFISFKPEVVISGSVARSSKLTINGAPIYPDEQGHFEVAHLLQVGLNTIEVKATNVLGKETIIYRQVLLRKEL